jgi:glycosyltransferase involved in cell wall biosynthesis
MTFHKPLLYLDYYRRAHAVAMGQHFDVYHAHDLNTLPVAAAAARSTGRPLVYDSHELYPDVSGLSRKERVIWRRIEPRLIGRASRVVTVCESIAGELVDRYGIARPQVLLNCPPIATAPADPSARPLRVKAGLEDSDEPIVLYQGGFAPGRGLDTLIDAAAHLRRGVVVLMGWGAIEKELAQRIRERGLDEKVRIIPPANRADLLEYTAGADVGVIPYQPVGLNNLYTTPNKLFEYVAANVPVAGSAVPEITRFLSEYGLGATFDPYDPRDMAATIEGLLDDPERLREIRANASAAAGILNWEREQEKLLRIYEELGGIAVPARRG